MDTERKINIDKKPDTKRKRRKKKTRCGEVSPAGGKGEKGEPKSAAFGGLKRKSPPPFPPRSGYRNRGKPFGFTHRSHSLRTPPFSSPTFSRKRKL